MTYVGSVFEGNGMKIANFWGLASFYIKTCSSTLTTSLVVKA